MNDVKMENGSQNMKIPWRLHLNMEKFFIPINPYCQTEDNTCGLCCLRMVMNYHGFINLCALCMRSTFNLKFF